MKIHLTKSEAVVTEQHFSKYAAFNTYFDRWVTKWWQFWHRYY